MASRIQRLSGCACCGISRRRFLSAGCATCASAAGLLTTGGRTRAAENDRKLRIRIIYSLHAIRQSRLDWPHAGFDFQPVTDRLEAELAKRCPEFDFVISLASGPEDAGKILKEDESASVDGYLVFQMNCWNPVIQTILTSGKPTLYADFKYGGSGGFLVYTAGFLRNKTPNLGFLASSNPEDLAAAVKCFGLFAKGGTMADFVAATARERIQRTPAPGDLACKPDAIEVLTPEECMAAMKQSKIVAVGDSWPAIQSEITQEMGIEIVDVTYEELVAASEKASPDRAAEIADRWQESAAKIEDVSPETIKQAAAMYLGQKALLEQHQATAITINCLTGFLAGKLTAYPCLGHHELLNDGLVGACECDVRSTATMIAMTALTKGRPGFISDPIIDTASRQIVYAHCVASNRAFGPEGEANPFEILTHSEDREGASVRSTLPLGYMTTSVEFGPESKTILFHRGKAVENVVDERACRTKLAVEPIGDIENLFTQWDKWIWHRVTYYGDLKEPVFALADALGWKVLEEA